MGGGMTFGEPFDFGFRYPYGGARKAPVYRSVFPPGRRSSSSFWGDESYPEDVTNMARKRKLDGVKGEPLGVANAKNVREIIVEDPSVNRTSRTRDLQTQRKAVTSGGTSSPARPSARKENIGRNSSEGHTVTIPVVFSCEEESKQQPVPIVPPEGIKKPRRTLSEEAAAILIQSTFRGFSLRRTKPLEHMRRISSTRTKLKELESLLSDAGQVQKMRTDVNFRLRFTEGIMALLLQLDSIQGVHSDVRVWRKAATKEVVTFLERVDSLLKGEETLGTEPSVQGHDEATAMVVEDGYIANDGGSRNDELMTETVSKDHTEKTQDTVRSGAEEIVLDRLKLEDDEGVTQLEETAVATDVRNDIGGRVGEVAMDDFELQSSQRTNITDAEEIVLDRLKLEDDEGVTQLEGKAVATDVHNDIGERVGEVAMDDSELQSSQRTNITDAIGQQEMREEAGHGPQQTGEAFQDTNVNELAHCEVETSTSQLMNDDCEVSTESTGGRDEEQRREESVSYETKETSDRPQVIPSEALDVPSATLEGEQHGMEVDGEHRDPPERHEDEYVGSLSMSKDVDFGLKTNPRDPKKMKVFLKDISCPPASHCTRSNAADEVDCFAARGTFSDIEESDVAGASSALRTSHGSDGADGGGGGTSGRAEKAEQHHPLLLKLCEENKMLKSLLLDVMKWNQLQANYMRNVTERLGKLEDKLMKKKVSNSKPKAQRCTRSRLERRLRR